MTARAAPVARAFLVSQPRAGSTLLQRVLGGHPDVATRSEPWVMLRALSRPRDADEAQLMDRAVAAFTAEVPGGSETMGDGSVDRCAEAYRRVAANDGARVFLDKTPRYYRILSELAGALPDARLIVLLRHPMAVLASIWALWLRDHPEHIATYRDDLLRAPAMLLAGIERWRERVAVVHFEDLVRSPEPVIERLCRHLEVAPLPGLADYGELQPFALGDPGVHRRTRPHPEVAGAWRQAVRDPRLWPVAMDYLEALGDPTVRAMGYDPAEAREVLRTVQPGGWRRIIGRLGARS